MHLASLLTCYALATAATAANICPLLGPVFPAPKNLHSEAAFQDTLKSIKAKIDGAFIAGNTTHGLVIANDTYSIQFFSTESEQLLFDYHHRGSDLLSSRPIDGDSIYAIASVSKLITVYLLLIQAGEEIFSDKVTKYIPELAGAAYWDEITVGSVAGFLSDITAEINDFTSIQDFRVLFPGVFPALDPEEVSGCSFSATGGCTREAFLQTLIRRPAPYQPNTTPSYSNAAFSVIGFVLEAVANSTYREVLDDLLLKPLKLESTSISKPINTTYAVIPGDAARSGWSLNFTDTASAAMGGYISTPNELSAIGRSILRSSLLPSSTTRAWMKPTSFTSALLGAVGHGLEIYRAPINTKHNRIVDLYTKGGNLPGYGANILLIPDFDMGIVLMQAGQRSTTGQSILGMVLDDLLPALDETARVQADAAFAGSYAATNGLNTTVKLTSTPGIPGLSIVEYVSNGTDMRSDFFLNPEWFQMYPTNIKSADGKQYSWRSSDLTVPDTGSPLDACPSWAGIDRPGWGLYGVDDFVFHIGDDGEAWAIEPKALKIVLEKVKA